MSSSTGPTPPPPPMYAAPLPPAPPQPAGGPGLSEMQRLVNVFIAPSKTFADLQRNPSWWKPWAISAVFTLLFGIVVVQKVDIPRFLQQQIDRSPSAQQRLEQLTPEQRERGMAIQATMTKGGFYGYWLVILIGGIIFAAVLMAVFNFMLGSEVPFQRALAVVFYSFFTWNLATILLTVSVLVSADANTIDLSNPMPTNPAFFMDPQGNKFIYVIMSSFDVFKIWAVILLGLGFAAASSNRKPAKGTAITTMFVIYAVLVLVGAAWKSIF
jgi:Yip1-like protein